MARSRTVTIKVPQPVLDALEAHHLGATFGNYPSRNALLVGVLTYAALFPVPHTLTAAIARLPESDQDKIHDLILSAAQSGRSLADELPKPATVEALLYLAQRL
jgi:hypothetical protein